MSMTSSSNSLSADINVTPLIDVLLVLLIIFMVITPSAVNGIDTLLPQPPRSHTTPQTEDTIVVELRDAGDQNIHYAINNQPLSKNEIASKLATIFATRINRVIFLKADAALDFSPVAEVIDTAHRIGIDNIGILTPQTKSTP